MKRRMKRMIILLGIVVLAIHFSLIFFYSLKPNNFSSLYTYPYFHQNWNLFVPPPDSNYHLYATYQNKGAKTTDIFRELLNKHQSNRLGGTEQLIIALSNSIHYFEKETLPGKITNVEEGTKFSLIQKFALNYLKLSRGATISDLKLILVVTQTNSKQVKVYYN